MPPNPIQVGDILLQSIPSQSNQQVLRSGTIVLADDTVNKPIYAKIGTVSAIDASTVYVDKISGTTGTPPVGVQDVNVKNTDYATNTLQATQNTKIDTTNSTLNDILLELRDDIQVSETVWYDKNDNTKFYVRTTSVNEDTGTITISFKNIDGTTATPTVANLIQTTAQAQFSPVTYDYKVATAGTGYAVNDFIQELQLVKSDGTVATTAWFNRTQNTVLSTAPVFANLVKDTSFATSTKQDIGNTSLGNINTQLTTGIKQIYSTGAISYANQNLVANTAITLFPAVATGTRSSLLITNTGNTTIWINLNTAATVGAGVPILPNGTYSRNTADGINNNAVSVITNGTATVSAEQTVI
jgi:hypothetical protein